MLLLGCDQIKQTAGGNSQRETILIQYPKNVIQDGRTVMMLSITYSLIMIQSISSSLNMNWEVTLVPI